MSGLSYIGGNGLSLHLFDADVETSRARDLSDFRKVDRAPGQIEAYNAVIMRRRRQQKRKALAAWAVRQPVPGALSAARSPARESAP